jgi:ABC-type enterochelin transport system permease subunit
MAEVLRFVEIVGIGSFGDVISSVCQLFSEEYPHIKERNRRESIDFFKVERKRFDLFHLFIAILRDNKLF